MSLITIVKSSSALEGVTVFSATENAQVYFTLKHIVDCKVNLILAVDTVEISLLPSQDFPLTAKKSFIRMGPLNLKKGSKIILESDVTNGCMCLIDGIWVTDPVGAEPIVTTPSTPGPGQLPLDISDYIFRQTLSTASLQFNTFNDTTGNYPATISGTVTEAVGRSGVIYEVINGYISFPELTNFPWNGATLSFWFDKSRASKMEIGNNSADGTGGTWSGSYNRVYFSANNPSTSTLNKIKVVVGQGNDSNAILIDMVETANWSNIVITFNRDSATTYVYTVYLDGVIIGSSQRVITTEFPAIIGNFWTSFSPPAGFYGIEDIIIWNKVLSDSERSLIR